MLLGVIAIAYATCATLPTLPVIVAVIAVLMLCLGLGNGAVFQMVPQRFAREIGLVTASSARSAASAASSCRTCSARRAPSPARSRRGS
jgi:nitrate/nitrite transporter NarK